MTRQRPSTTDARRPRVGADVPLQPPPRPGAPDVRSPERTPASSSPARSIAGAALLGVLALAMAGVFVLLPRWVASRPRPLTVVPSPAAPEGPASPVPREVTPETLA